MMFTIRGIPTAGIAVGTAFVLQRRASAAATAAAGDPVAEAGRFHAALERAKAELSALAEGEAVFAAHLEMAGDPMLAGLVEGRLAEKHLSAEQALGEACEEVCGMFAALDDDYLRGRTDDVRDVCARIGRVLSGETVHDPFAGLAPGTIVVADELAPSDTAQMDFGRVAGLVTAHGSVTSHVAIIARNKGIAALVGVAGCMRQVRTGDRLIIDGERGELIVDPDPATGRKYAARLESLRQDAFRCAADAQAPAVTPAGRRITVLGNAANVDEVRRALDAGAEGIGLFRSEFLYMQGPALPDEETQFAAYRAAAELCGARPLTVRTLDIGGDKALPYMHFEPEENPFLGWRAIRVSLAMPELFRTQLRALLRASAFGNVRVMFPMIASVGEFRAAKAVVETCMAELDAEGVAYDRDIALGVMIETPESDFTLVCIADPQCATTAEISRYVNETIPDVETTVDGYKAKGTPVYGITLGDIVFDTPDLWSNMKESMANRNLPIFQTIGNHDHLQTETSDDNAAANFETQFGPRNYSFNRGDVHIVSMDNVLYEGKKKYKGGITDKQLEWLRQDLSHVDKDKLVIFCAHIPFRGGTSVTDESHENYDGVLDLLSGFSEAHIMIGHTHYHQKYIHKRNGKTILEHVHGAACGAWWTANICADGTPNGYSVYEISGNTVANQYYKSTNKEAGYQIRAYSATQVFGKSGSLTFGWAANAPAMNDAKCIVANVWNSDASGNWKVSLWQNGTKVCDMTRVKTYDYWAYAYHVLYYSKSVGTTWGKNLDHYYYGNLASGTPETADFEIVAEDGMGNTYRTSKLQTDFIGF